VFEGFAPPALSPPLHLAGFQRGELIGEIIIPDRSLDQFAVRRHKFFSSLDGRQSFTREFFDHADIEED
jgi:hypothetical protein